MMTYTTTVNIPKSVFENVNQLLKEGSPDPFDRSGESIFTAQFDDGSSVEYTLAAGIHNYYDDVVWVGPETEYKRVNFEPTYELPEHLEVSVNGDTYIINIIKGETEMKKWSVPVYWEMVGRIEVEAETAEAAHNKVLMNPDDYALPSDGEYLPDSFEADPETPIELIKLVEEVDEPTDDEPTDAEALFIDPITLFYEHPIMGFFSNGRVNREELPAGLYLYEFRGDGGEEDFCSVEKRVVVNFSGAFITDTAIEFPDDDYISLPEDDTPNFATDYDPPEFYGWDQVKKWFEENQPNRR